MSLTAVAIITRVYRKSAGNPVASSETGPFPIDSTVCLASSAQEQGKAARVKVEIHLAAEHAPDSIKAGATADLKFVLSSVKTKGKVMYRTKGLADGVEVVAVKRQEKPADPNKAVLVELRVTKEQAAKIEKAKVHTVTVVESEPGGKVVSTKRPVPLRLEPVKAAKE
jgi:hypothetical protein